MAEAEGDQVPLDLEERSKRLQAIRTDAANSALLAREELERLSARGLPEIAHRANELARARHEALEALQEQFATERTNVAKPPAS